MAKKKKQNKRPVCIRHAQRRCRERFGLEMTDADHDEIVNKIQKGGAMHVMTESHSRTHWLVPFKGHYLPVVYLKSHGCLATVLPSEAIGSNLSAIRN